MPRNIRERRVSSSSSESEADADESNEIGAKECSDKAKKSAAPESSIK